MQPFFYVVAGPNGVGKTTDAFQFLASHSRNQSVAANIY